MLQKIYQLTEENNDMLLSIKRSMRIARIWSLVYWVFIIGTALGAYYIIQPYIDQLVGVYGSASTDIQNAKSILDSFNY